MRPAFWLVLALWVFLAGCAPRAYPPSEPVTDESPWYIQGDVPPLPVPKEAQ
jgi:hypothetical protein